jgi:hypothetical protein
MDGEIFYLKLCVNDLRSHFLIYIYFLAEFQAVALHFGSDASSSP